MFGIWTILKLHGKTEIILISTIIKPALNRVKKIRELWFYRNCTGKRKYKLLDFSFSLLLPRHSAIMTNKIAINQGLFSADNCP